MPIRRHRVVGVFIDGKTYVCDVGTGRTAPKWPLELKENLVQEQFGEAYKFIKEDFFGWVLCELHEGSWRRVYSFTEEVQHEVDFITPSFYCEKHPDSPFNKAVMVSLKNATGRKTISGNEYRVFEGEESVMVKPNLETHELIKILKDEFGLEWAPKIKP